MPPITATERNDDIVSGDTDKFFMRAALEMAAAGARAGEVPVGAVLVSPAGEIVARAHNRPIGLSDPTAHAEIVVIRQACSRLGTYRLPGYSLYVTLEPCVMCVGAMIQARIARLVYGAADPKAGAVESVFAIGTGQELNHRFQAMGGVLAQEAGALLRGFFRERREKGSAPT